MNENEIKPGSLEAEANKAITCLYIAVDACIADGVKQRVGAFVCQMKREYAEKNETANVFMGQVKKLQAEAEACRKILGYNDGDLLDNVTRYHAYATHEIELLRAGGERVAAYARKLQELLPQDTVMKLGFTAVQESVASVPND